MPTRKILTVMAVVIALAMTTMAPALASKVVKSTGKDAATMSAQKVWDNGGVYENACVSNAIAAGYKGKVNLIQPAGNPAVILGMSFGNLVPGTYQVFIDWNGGTPGPWGLIGTFTADEYGSGSFNYKVPADGLADATHTWGVWVNGPAPCGSILQTDTDLTFTTGS